jgi:hypothetical protein
VDGRRVDAVELIGRQLAFQERFGIREELQRRSAGESRAVVGHLRINGHAIGHAGGALFDPQQAFMHAGRHFGHGVLSVR